MVAHESTFHGCTADLIREMTTLSKSKVGKNLDGLFLFFDCRFYKILNREHSQQLAVFYQRQVTNIGGKHFFHADLNTLLGLGKDALVLLWVDNFLTTTTTTTTREITKTKLED